MIAPVAFTAIVTTTLFLMSYPELKGQTIMYKTVRMMISIWLEVVCIVTVSASMIATTAMVVWLLTVMVETLFDIY